MKICYVCNEYPDGPHGGVGTMTQLLAEELTLRKHSVKVAGVCDLSYPSPDYEIKNGVEITRIKVNFKSKISVVFGFWSLAKKIRVWIQKGEIDIIEAPDSYGVFSLFANFTRPFILRANGNNTYFSSILNIPIGKNTLFYEKNLYKKAFAICAVSSFTASQMRKLYNIGNPIPVIYNAVEVINSSNLAVNEDMIYNKFSEVENPIIFSGTLVRKKGIYELVEAVLFLLNQQKKITLIINGKDTIDTHTGNSVKKELLNLIPDHLKKSFIFNGHVSRAELMQQYKIAKAAVFPSFAEAFAFAPLEAMAAGVLTIFSNTCSGEELIENKIDGLIIDPFKVETISNALEYVLKNPEKASEIASRGQMKIKDQFSKEMMTTRSINFYEEVIDKFSNNR